MPDTSTRAAGTNHGARHQSLKSWVACHELVLAVYRETRRWPPAEQYGLTSQARRSAYSAAANIAEGEAYWKTSGSGKEKRYKLRKAGWEEAVAIVRKIAGE